MRRYAFVQADVFTDRPFGGNQLAVFTDARGLSAAEMQTLAQEMNFSETTFVLPPELPEAAQRVRIFTPALEMPMAGHPTVGTAFVLAQRGALPGPTAVLQLNIGAVTVEIERDAAGAPQFVWMNHRAPEFSPAPADRARVAAALGVAEADLRADLPLEVGSTGVPYLLVPFASLAAIRRARVDQPALRRLFTDDLTSVYLFTAETADPAAQLHTRMFTPLLGDIPEDPATGSAAAPLAAYAVAHGLVPDGRFLIEQGLELGRPSRIYVAARRAGAAFAELKIGGQAVSVGQGELFW